MRFAVYSLANRLATSSKREQLTETRKKQHDPESEKREKERSTSFRQAFRIGVWLLFSTKRLWGVGLWLRDAGRGVQRSGDPVIGTSGDRKTQFHRGGAETRRRQTQQSQSARQSGMSWDDPGGEGAAQSAAIADNADIARHRRDRKSKTSEVHANLG